jgi:hypothetical protein
MPNGAPYYGINPEVVDSYRRTLEFNNSLLLQQYDHRYDFNTSEYVRKITTYRSFSRPATEEEVQKYLDSRARNKEKRRMIYEKKLRDNVEPSIRRYA